MKLAALLLIALLAAPIVLADSFNSLPGENFTLTTTCLLNGVLAADNASFFIKTANGTIFQNATDMTPVTPGVFKSGVVFNQVGQYVAVQTCNYPGGVSANGTDDITVDDLTFQIIVLVLALTFTIIGIRKSGFLAGGAFFFIIWAVFYNKNIYIGIVLLLFSITLLYRAWSKREQ